jgi:hypothetical protein
VFLRGKSPCPICGRLIARDEAVVAFTHFLGREHRLWRFSDCAMHKECFEIWPDRDEFEALYEAFKERVRLMRTPERLEERRRERARADEARRRDDREHNERHKRVMTIVRTEGAKCPHCGTRAVEYRELTGAARLRLACLACHRSLNACDLQLR